jgi:hypothetical protein
MYTDLLLQAIEATPAHDGSGHALVERLVASEVWREEKPRSGSQYVSEVLAHEIAYDQALIELCAALGIDAEPESFTSPMNARARLEHELTDLVRRVYVED